MWRRSTAAAAAAADAAAWGSTPFRLAITPSSSSSIRTPFPAAFRSSVADVFWRFHSTSAASASADGLAEAALGPATVASSSSSLVSSKVEELVGVTRHYGRCYWELSKARLSLLVVATSGTGYVLGSGSAIDFAGLCWTCAGTMMVAASANSLNQVFEKQNDALMRRTQQRPLPSGRITIPHAAMWASSVGMAGTTLLACKTNSLAAGLAASNLVLYAFLYTPLKQIHPINTWVGAVVGAIPPLLGWAAASGEVSLNGMILPAALYFWQIPHFMALAYLCRNDYAAGGFRMFSLADASGQKTAFVSLRNCLYLLPLGYLAYDSMMLWGLGKGTMPMQHLGGIASKWVFLESSFLTLCITAAAVSFVRERTTKSARRMFHASLLYLPVFMSGLLLHRLPNEETEPMLIESNGLPISEGQICEEGRFGINKKRDRYGIQSRPPVAYASIAPFPFLPAPLYVPPDS